MKNESAVKLVSAGDQLGPEDQTKFFARLNSGPCILSKIANIFLKNGTLRVLVYVVDQVCGFVRPGHPEGPATPPPQFELLPTGDAAILLPPA